MRILSALNCDRNQGVMTCFERFFAVGILFGLRWQGGGRCARLLVRNRCSRGVHQPGAEIVPNTQPL